MVQALVAHGWDFDVERGPDWLFVRPRLLDSQAADVPFMAEQVWALLEQNRTHRLVLEMAEIPQLDSQMIDQLLWLEERIRGCEGTLRICGLSPENQRALCDGELAAHLPRYSDRTEAVMSQSWPNHPR